MKIQFTIWLLVLSFYVRSQSLENIKAHYICDVKGRELDAISPSASLQLNLNDGDVIFRDYIGAIFSGRPAVDTLLNNYKNMRIVFEGTVQESVNDFMEGDRSADLMHVSGNLLINGISRSISATCVPVRYNKSSNELYMNFNMVFNPADFNLRPPAFPFSDALEVSVKNGFVTKIE